jgi:hypothetical protein
MEVVRRPVLRRVAALAWKGAQAFRHMHREMTLASQIMLRPAGAGRD